MIVVGTVPVTNGEMDLTEYWNAVCLNTFDLMVWMNRSRLVYPPDAKLSIEMEDQDGTDRYR